MIQVCKLFIQVVGNLQKKMPWELKKVQYISQKRLGLGSRRIHSDLLLPHGFGGWRIAPFQLSGFYLRLLLVMVRSAILSETRSRRPRAVWALLSGVLHNQGGPTLDVVIRIILVITAVFIQYHSH